MSVSEDYMTYVLGQFESLGAVAARKMFGGAMLHLGGVYFALIADDILYLKVDDSNKPDYEAAGMGPFRPFGSKTRVMQFYEVPADVLEDKEKLELWSKKALDAAARKPPAVKKKKA